MAEPPPRRFRRTLGLFEAALLLVLAAGVLWMVRPVPGAREAAEAEKAVLAALAAVANAEDARATGGRGGCLPLDALLAAEPGLGGALREFRPSAVPGVLGNRSFWVTVLVTDEDGWLAAPGTAGRASPDRGYAVLAWPRADAARLLRPLASLPGGVQWQGADGMPGSGDPARPPVPRAFFPEPGSQGPRVPDPPPDWVQSRRRETHSRPVSPR